MYLEYFHGEITYVFLLFCIPEDNRTDKAQKVTAVTVDMLSNNTFKKNKNYSLSGLYVIRAADSTNW